MGRTDEVEALRRPRGRHRIAAFGGKQVMSPTMEQLGIDRLSSEDRLQLIGEIWESLTPIDQLEIPESHRQELDRRLAAADADPSAGRPWGEVRARLRGEE
jgi:putative addiction module component (TIGR02574 family)